MKNLQLLAGFAIVALTLSVCGNADAQLMVTEDLLIRLDGTDVEVVIDEVDGGVQDWNNQVAPENVPTAFSAIAVGNRPQLLVDQPMPNGSLHATLDFDKGGTGTGAPVLSSTPYLTAGPSSVFDSLKTLTMFSVFKVDNLAPEGNVVGQREQVVFASRHLNTTPEPDTLTAAWSHTFEDDSVTDVEGQPETIGNQPAIMPQFRQLGTLNELFTDTDLSPAAVAADTWYVVASRWNGTIDAVNGQPAYTTTSVVMTPGATLNSVVTVSKSTTSTGEFDSWSTHDGFTIGKNATVGTAGSARRGFLDGQIAEILIYGDTLTETDFQSVIDYLSQKYLVASEEVLTGDYNGDGFVNLADYTVWRDTLGAMGAGLAADGDGNMEVNALDYDLWKEHFGESLEPLSSITGKAVPEPSALLIAGIGLLASVAMGRRVSRCRTAA